MSRNVRYERRADDCALALILWNVWMLRRKQPYGTRLILCRAADIGVSGTSTTLPGPFSDPNDFAQPDPATPVTRRPRWRPFAPLQKLRQG